MTLRLNLRMETHFKYICGDIDFPTLVLGGYSFHFLVLGQSLLAIDVCGVVCVWCVLCSGMKVFSCLSYLIPLGY